MERPSPTSVPALRNCHHRAVEEGRTEDHAVSLKAPTLLRWFGVDNVSTDRQQRVTDSIGIWPIHPTLYIAVFASDPTELAIGMST